MSDPLCREEAGCVRIGASGRRSRKFVWTGIVVFLAFCWLALSSLDHRSYTCAVCRADRLDRSCLGLSWSRSQETDCSRWYASHVEPDHDHSWSAYGRCRRFGIPGIYGGFACSLGAPITHLSQTVQIEIYQHFQHPIDAKPIFIQMGDRVNSFQMIDILMKWVDAGYPGTWPDWCEKHRDDPQ